MPALTGDTSHVTRRNRQGAAAAECGVIADTWASASNETHMNFLKPIECFTVIQMCAGTLMSRPLRGTFVGSVCLMSVHQTLLARPICVRHDGIIIMGMCDDSGIAQAPLGGLPV
jgi:hypothetical protein